MVQFIKMSAALLFLFQSLAFAGPRVGNGGDGVALEFSEVVSMLPHAIENWPQKPTYLDLKKITDLLPQLKVDSVDELNLNETPKDAVNYPEEKRVVVSRKRWIDLDLTTKYALALHEVLGLLLVDDSKYNVSSNFREFLVQSNEAYAMPAGWVSVCDRSQNIRNFLEARLEMKCSDITPDVLSQIKTMNLSRGSNFDPSIAFKSKDLAGLTSLKAFNLKVDANDKTVFIPDQFFIYNFALNNISLLAPLALGAEVFNSGVTYDKVLIGGYGSVIIDKRSTTCAEGALNGLKVNSIGINMDPSSSCQIQDIISVQQLVLGLNANFDAKLLQKVPSMVEILEMNSSDKNVPAILPREVPANLNSVRDLKLGNFLLGPDQFSGFKNLKSVSLENAVKIDANAFRSSNLENFTISIFNVYGQRKYDYADYSPKFLRSLPNLKSLTFDLTYGNAHASLEQYDFSSQSHLEDLKIFTSNSMASSFFAHFKNLKSLVLDSEFQNNLFDRDDLKDLVHLETLTFIPPVSASDVRVDFDLRSNSELKSFILRRARSVVQEDKDRLVTNYGTRMNIVLDPDFCEAGIRGLYSNGYKSCY